MNWMVVSETFKSTLEQLNLDYLEFLPVGLLDHKGRSRKELYWIVNFTKLLPAVNREQSVFKERIGGNWGFLEN